MSNNSTQSQRKLPAPKDFDEYMTWRMRWFLIIALTVAYTLSLIGGLLGYGITRDLHYLLFITPTALVPFVRYLVPMDKRRYDLQVAQLERDKKLAEANLRIQLLEAELAKQQSDTSKQPAGKP